MCFWPNSLLISSSTPSTAPKPLCLVANGWSWVACMFSTIVHDGQPVENPHLAAPAARIFFGKASTSCHVLGGFSGSRPGLLEGVLVVVEDRRRRVVRHRVELAVLRVVADHRLDEVVPVDLDLVLLHQLVHRVHGAGQHHGLGADLEHLHDVRRVLLPVRGDGGGERLRVAALAQRLDLVLALAVVELLDLGLQRLAERAGHRVPEVDLVLASAAPGARGRAR